MKGIIESGRAIFFGAICEGMAEKLVRKSVTDVFTVRYAAGKVGRTGSSLLGRTSHDIRPLFLGPGQNTCFGIFDFK